LSEAMARKLRVEYPGAIYHVMNRGDRRKAIFLDDADRERFVATLGEACVSVEKGNLAMSEQYQEPLSGLFNPEAA
jgi:hypothetical protein